MSDPILIILQDDRIFEMPENLLSQDDMKLIKGGELAAFKVMNEKFWKIKWVENSKLMMWCPMNGDEKPKRIQK